MVLFLALIYAFGVEAVLNHVLFFVSKGELRGARKSNVHFVRVQHRIYDSGMELN